MRRSTYSLPSHVPDHAALAAVDVDRRIRPRRGSSSPSRRAASRSARRTVHLRLTAKAGCRVGGGLRWSCELLGACGFGWARPDRSVGQRLRDTGRECGPSCHSALASSTRHSSRCGHPPRIPQPIRTGGQGCAARTVRGTMAAMPSRPPTPTRRAIRPARCTDRTISYWLRDAGPGRVADPPLERSRACVASTSSIIGGGYTGLWSGDRPDRHRSGTARRRPRGRRPSPSGRAAGTAGSARRA